MSASKKGPDGLYPTERRVDSVGMFRVGGNVRLTELQGERLKLNGIGGTYIERLRAGGTIFEIVTSDAHGWISIGVDLPAGEGCRRTVHYFAPSEIETFDPNAEQVADAQERIKAQLAGMSGLFR